MRIVSIVPVVGVALSVAFCGFHPQPTSGTVACTVGGSACCPADYVCVGRGAITADGLPDGIGTCWSKQDLPPEALSATHDYTPNILNDPACLVTDWLAPSISLPDGGILGAGGRVIGGGGGDSGGGDVGIDPGIPIPAAVSHSIACGMEHTCAVVDGRALCWGDNNWGQIGNGIVSDWELVPVQVVGLESGVSAIAASGVQTCAVAAGGVWCWGRNPDQTHTRVPVQVPGLESGVTAVCVGDAHGCAVVNGAAKCWGEYPELGDGTGANHYTPVQVKGLTSGVTDIACGSDHSCAVVNGGVLCWGSDWNGQLGDGVKHTAYEPVKVSKLTLGVTAISASSLSTSNLSGFSCAIVGGAAMCWGAGERNELGNGSLDDKLVPTQVSGLTGSVGAIASYDHTCVILGGEALCWGGDNRFGEIGDGTTEPRGTPVKVVGLDTNAVTSIAVGYGHTCAVVGAEIKCWGNNTYGELGNNSMVRSSTPVLVQF